MQKILDLDVWRQSIVDSMSGLLAAVAGFLPDLALALGILAFGWLAALLLERITRRGLRTLGLDRVVARLRGGEAVGRAGSFVPTSSTVARLIFWLVLLAFGLSAVEALGVDVARTTIERLISFVPSLVAAVLLLVAGVLLGRLLRSLVDSSAVAGSVGYADRLGAVAQVTVVTVAGVLALEQLGVETALLVVVLGGLLVTTALSMGVALALGSSALITHILAGHYLRQSLPAGRIAEVQGRRGVVETVGPVATIFRGEDQSWSVPNARLLEEIVSH